MQASVEFPVANKQLEVVWDSDLFSVYMYEKRTQYRQNAEHTTYAISYSDSKVTIFLIDFL